MLVMDSDQTSLDSALSIQPCSFGLDSCAALTLPNILVKRTSILAPPTEFKYDKHL